MGAASAAAPRFGSESKEGALRYSRTIDALLKRQVDAVHKTCAASVPSGMLFRPEEDRIAAVDVDDGRLFELIPIHLRLEDEGTGSGGISVRLEIGGHPDS